MTNISFIIPAYNCQDTIRETVESITQTNCNEGDEIVIVNDGSTDHTKPILNRLMYEYPVIRIIDHSNNKGAGAARNTAIRHSKHEILFCLDSDNVLEKNSINLLKSYMISENADACVFRKFHFFKNTISNRTHTWIYKHGIMTLADSFTGNCVPGASGNYMFTKDSWIKVNGYPEDAGAVDTWGFGLRQLANNCKIFVIPTGHYFQRWTNTSYWTREQKNNHSNQRKLLLEYAHLFDTNSLHYINTSKAFNFNTHPLQLKSGEKGKIPGISTLKYSLLDRMKINVCAVKNKLF